MANIEDRVLELNDNELDNVVSGVRWYAVKAGDTLESIAEKFGVDWQIIAQRNGIINPNLIKVGQRIIING